MNFGKTFGAAAKKTAVFQTQQTQPRYLTQAGQVCNGGSLKEVKLRIKSVTAIRKITKTMNMIATARLKQAQGRMEKARFFYNTIGPLAEALPLPPAESAKKHLIITLGSDKGLCGAINTNIAKQTRLLIKDKEQKGSSVNITCIGEKVSGQLAREHGTKILFTVGETSKRPINFLMSSLIADRILETDFDMASVFYNKFNTIISYTTTEKALPSPQNCVSRRNQVFTKFEFEDDEYAPHIADFMQYYTAALLFHCHSDGITAELGGRMSSMDNATRNAGEVIKRLTIMYNRRRQAAITTELTEIISGAAAIQQ